MVRRVCCVCSKRIGNAEFVRCSTCRRCVHNSIFAPCYDKFPIPERELHSRTVEDYPKKKKGDVKNWDEERNKYWARDENWEEPESQTQYRECNECAKREKIGRRNGNDDYIQRNKERGKLRSEPKRNPEFIDVLDSDEEKEKKKRDSGDANSEDFTIALSDDPIELDLNVTPVVKRKLRDLLNDDDAFVDMEHPRGKKRSHNFLNDEE